jgi:hypothetical protein
MYPISTGTGTYLISSLRILGHSYFFPYNKSVTSPPEDWNNETALTIYTYPDRVTLLTTAASHRGESNTSIASALALSRSVSLSHAREML